MFEYIVFMYVLEADILNTDLESTIAKYKSYTSINYHSLCSGICHDIDTIATFQRTSDSNSHSKHIQKCLTRLLLLRMRDSSADEEADDVKTFGMDSSCSSGYKPIND